MKRRLSKSILLDELYSTSVAICHAMGEHDDSRVEILQYHYLRIESILNYVNEESERIPPVV